MTQHANFQGVPFCRGTEQHLTVKVWKMKCRLHFLLVAMVPLCPVYKQKLKNASFFFFFFLSFFLFFFLFLVPSVETSLKMLPFLLDSSEKNVRWSTFVRHIDWYCPIKKTFLNFCWWYVLTYLSKNVSWAGYLLF